VYVLSVWIFKFIIITKINKYDIIRLKHIHIQEFIYYIITSKSWTVAYIYKYKFFILILPMFFIIFLFPFLIEQLAFDFCPSMFTFIQLRKLPKIITNLWPVHFPWLLLSPYNDDLLRL